MEVFIFNFDLPGRYEFSYFTRKYIFDKVLFLFYLKTTRVIKFYTSRTGTITFKANTLAVTESKKKSLNILLRKKKEETYTTKD